MSSIKIKKRNKIKKRIKQKVLGNKICPRLSVFRSNKEIYAQLIDDQNGNTIVSASSRDKDLLKKDASRTELSKLVAQRLAKKAQEKKITKIYFDRGLYKYHGRIKIFAETLRENGMEF